MTDHQSPAAWRGANTAQLKADIDSGRTGDKIAGFDPGAVPLGVDEEAGGHFPSPELAALARAQERAGRPSSATVNAAQPELAPDAQLGPQPGMLAAALGGIAIAALLGLLFLAAL